MSTSKHPAPTDAQGASAPLASRSTPSGGRRATPPRDDLETDPGIGASRGTTISGEDPHILREDGENTEEGDVGNDTDATGAVVPNERHRTNP